MYSSILLYAYYYQELLIALALLFAFALSVNWLIILIVRNLTVWEDKDE